MLALAVSLAFFTRYAFRQPRLVKDHIDEATAAAGAASRPSYLLYAIAIAVGLLLPFVAVALYLGIALYLAVPVRTIRRLVQR